MTSFITAYATSEDSSDSLKTYQRNYPICEAVGNKCVDTNPSNEVKRFESTSSTRYALPTNSTMFHILFSDQNIKFISDMITAKTKCIVSDDQIVKVLDSFYKNGYKDMPVLTAMTAEYISNYILEERKTFEKNKKLNIWVTQYITEASPDEELRLGENRLSRTDTVKVREKSKNTGMMIETY
jgi:hypothetical protein